MKPYAKSIRPTRTIEVFSLPSGRAFIRRTDAGGKVTEWESPDRTAAEWVALQRYPAQFQLEGTPQ